MTTNYHIDIGTQINAYKLYCV